MFETSCNTTENRALIKEAFGLLAYPNPREGPMSHVLDSAKREPLANELNSAIMGESALSFLVVAPMIIMMVCVCVCVYGRVGGGRLPQPLFWCHPHPPMRVCAGSLSLLAKSKLEHVVQQASTCLSTMLDHGMGQAAFLSIDQFME
jgi:hypothetical protein